jgi:putative membrane protein
MMSEGGWLRRALVWWGIHSLSLWAAGALPGIHFQGGAAGFGDVLVVAFLFGLVHQLVKPLLMFVSCVVYVLTLGLFHFIVNALLLQLVAWLAGPRLVIDGFWDAFLGALVISVVSLVLGSFLDPQGTTVVRVRSGGGGEDPPDVITMG